MTKHQRRKQSSYPCPLCGEPRPNSGLPIAIPFGIPTYWSPEAALAIFEFVTKCATSFWPSTEPTSRTQRDSDANRHQQSG